MTPTRRRSGGIIICLFVVSLVNKPRLEYLTIQNGLGTVFLILAPHPSLLYVLVDFHLLTLHQPVIFITHLLISYTLTFMALSALIVCLARDPGPANAPPSRLEGADGEGEELALREALMPDNDFSSPGKWCRKCWVGTNDFTIDSWMLMEFSRPQKQKGPTIALFAIGVF